jgi:hypothetical protein
MVRENLGGSQENISNGAFCVHNLHDKTISNLVSFATAYISEQSTLVRFTLTPKITVLCFSYDPCVIFVGGLRDYTSP